MLSEICLMSFPSQRTAPSLGENRPAIRCSSVVLPVPLGPEINRRSPDEISTFPILNKNRLVDGRKTAMWLRQIFIPNPEQPSLFSRFVFFGGRRFGKFFLFFFVFAAE